MARKQNKERIQTHIKGFDSLIEGGIPTGSNILVSGTPGTGKTIFSMEFLYNGCTKDGDKCVYVTFEEKKEDLYKQAEQFGWNLKDLEKKKKLRIIALGTHNISKSTIEDFIEILKDTKSTRLVIDSITTLAYLAPENMNDTSPTQFTIKKFLYASIAKLKEYGDVTTMIISQKGEALSNGISEYLCDGVVMIDYESLGGDYSRNLIIRKMRRTKNDEDLHPLEISSHGIVVHNLD